MTRRKLKPAQERFWNRLTGQHNHKVREQLDYMRRNRVISRNEHRYLVDRSYGCSESEIWRLIIDHIRISTMQDFDQGVYRQPRKRRRNTAKKTQK
jgi:hypothetical protein